MSARSARNARRAARAAARAAAPPPAPAIGTHLVLDEPRMPAATLPAPASAPEPAAPTLLVPDADGETMRAPRTVAEATGGRPMTVTVGGRPVILAPYSPLPAPGVELLGWVEHARATHPGHGGWGRNIGGSELPSDPRQTTFVVRVDDHTVAIYHLERFRARAA